MSADSVEGVGTPSPEVVAWVARTCAAQGLPVRVGDGLVMAQVVALLGGGVGAPNGKRSAVGSPTLSATGKDGRDE